MKGVSQCWKPTAFFTNQKPETELKRPIAQKPCVSLKRLANATDGLENTSNLGRDIFIDRNTIEKNCPRKQKKHRVVCRYKLDFLRKLCALSE